MTPPADIVCFAKVRLRDGEEIKAQVEQVRANPPLSRPKLLEMILAASLLLEEAAAHIRHPSLRESARIRLAKRMEAQAIRLSDAIERENAALEVIASRPSMEDCEK